MLVLMGRFDGSSLMPRCMLPGLKIPEGYQPREALRRYLGTNMFHLRRWLDVDSDFEMKKEEAQSPTLAVLTQYHKATFSGTVKQGLRWGKISRRIQPSRC